MRRTDYEMEKLSQSVGSMRYAGSPNVPTVSLMMQYPSAAIALEPVRQFQFEARCIVVRNVSIRRGAQAPTLAVCCDLKSPYLGVHGVGGR